MMLKSNPVFAFILLNVLLVSKAREISSASGTADTIKDLKHAEKDVDNVIKVISQVKADRGIPTDTLLSPGEELVKEELDMLSEDAQKLQTKIASVTDKEADINFSSEDFTDYLNDMQSDTAVLEQDVDDLLSDVNYDRKQIKTYTNVTFDTDLELLRNETAHVVDEVSELRPARITPRKRKRRRNGRKDKIKSGAKSSSNSGKKRLQRNNVMMADFPNMPPTWRDPRCDYLLDSKPSGDSFVQPSAISLARTRTNDFDVSWLANYLQACPQCTVSTQGRQCPLTTQVLEMKKWANEVQEILTHGCIKPAGCAYPGTCCIAADMPIEQTIAGITNLLKDLYDMFHKKCTSCSAQGMLGDWMTWSAWSSCDATCGRAMRSRTRACRSGNCVGASIEREPCAGMPECCVDGNWATWENWASCSVTCGRGQTVRRRRCSRPAPNYCGQSCVGPREETRACVADRDCCVDGNWNSWSSWTACSSSCGDAMRTRIRTCNNPPPSSCGRGCLGDIQQAESCSSPFLSENGNWGTWQAWSACSVSCGRGYRNRRRACDSPPPGPCGRQCDGRETETAPCDDGRNPFCCVNGNWGSWQAWSMCSATCDIGNRRRRRSCDSPAPNYCGESCRGEELEMAACVTGVPCQTCVNGQWSGWEPWSRCPVTCGQGIHERRRSCDNPPANFCGQKCPGIERDQRTCDTGMPCRTCIDGNWGSWQSWSRCSVTCGRGVTNRRRLCDNPPANDCGLQCPGQDTAMRSCETGVTCEVCVNGNWGQWQAWSRCSVTCGSGIYERRRLCDNPAPNYCGQRCPGPDNELESCETNVPCQICVNGNWGTWQSWSRCSVTCGQGIRERRRSCDNPRANYCGLECAGPDREETACDAGVPCVYCVDGNWGAWQTWNRCTRTCGQGTRERRRSCDNPPANYCGQRCPGLEFETDVCDTGTVCEICVDGNWGSWQSWTMCSATCGRGFRERRRSCDNPSANYCGRMCPGQSSETGNCDSGVPCEVCVNGNWGPWSTLSSCSATCGEALVERTRRCDNPRPNYCGSPCVGSAEDIMPERCGPPRIDGQWSSWSSWSPCSASCGIGSILRSRSCSNPPPNACGLPCTGATDERVTCKGSGLCDCARKEWTAWVPASACPPSCGYAMRRMSRSCIEVEPGNECDNDCPGTSLQEARCLDLSTCTSSWSEWSACSVTCRGQGTRERFRTVIEVVRRGDTPVQVRHNYNETELCVVYEPECLDFVIGTEWGQWSACSATCRGQGVRERVISSSIRDIGTGEVPVESDAIRKEVVGCMVMEPECPSWGQWSACSATCRGRGVRERTISTSEGDIGTGDVRVETDATRKEVEDCVVDEPECPYGDAAWAEWDSWCPCDCRQGIRTRRRECEKANLLGMSAQKVPIALCHGEARDEEECDTRMQCPECITDCRDKSPGLYPSCFNCSYYVSCQENQNGVLLFCTPANTEWDAFTKSCTAAPSPSCTLHDCVNTCEEMMDGSYHSCEGCNSYVECRAGLTYRRQCPDMRMEWNQHKMRCEAERSPTCKRRAASTFSSIFGGALQRDAPVADNSLSDQKHVLSAANSNKQIKKQTPEDTLKQNSNNIKHNFNKNSAKLKSWEESPFVKEKHEDPKIPHCRTHCRNAAEGKYPSCRGCDYYVICRKYGTFQEKRCSDDRYWDDNLKSCNHISNTCSKNI